MHEAMAHTRQKQKEERRGRRRRTSTSSNTEEGGAGEAAPAPWRAAKRAQWRGQSSQRPRPTAPRTVRASARGRTTRAPCDSEQARSHACIALLSLNRANITITKYFSTIEIHSHSASVLRGPQRALSEPVGCAWNEAKWISVYVSVCLCLSPSHVRLTLSIHATLLTGLRSAL